MNSDAFLSELEERFLRYVQIDTQSDEASPAAPSTAKQYDLLTPLADELRVLSAADVRITDYGAVLATIPATPGVAARDLPVVAFLAHVDTAPDFSGADVKPIVHRQYDGQPIVLPDDPSQVLSPAAMPMLKSKMGEDIVTAGGATLLGADDKAGVAIVMTMAAELLRNPHISHGTIRICFTPDEEIGRGVDPRLPADLGADVAYTLDGDDVGSLTFETFSADKALVTITGASIHPGTAKGKMVNTLHLAAKILAALPSHTRTPETTDDREGFIHCYKLHGTTAHAELHFLLRDFEMDGLHSHAALLQQICQVVAAGEPRARIECTVTKQYRNMRDWLKDNMRPVELARQAYQQAGLEPFDKPIRGGTDGSRLTELGVPTPNLFTGMQEVHGPLEWISLQDMARATAVCVRLAHLWSASGEA
jgi:tripeptide aminopeptidase